MLLLRHPLWPALAHALCHLATDVKISTCAQEAISVPLEVLAKRLLSPVLCPALGRSRAESGPLPEPELSITWEIPLARPLQLPPDTGKLASPSPARHYTYQPWDTTTQRSPNSSDKSQTSFLPTLSLLLSRPRGHTQEVFNAHLGNRGIMMQICQTEGNNKNSTVRRQGSLTPFCAREP